jgi:hypothetical protein
MKIRPAKIFYRQKLLLSSIVINPKMFSPAPPKLVKTGFISVLSPTLRISPILIKGVRRSIISGHEKPGMG